METAAELGRWSEDQLRDFIDAKEIPHADCVTHAQLLRRALDAENGVAPSPPPPPPPPPHPPLPAESTTPGEPPPPPPPPAVRDGDEYDPLDAFMAGIEQTVVQQQKQSSPAATAAAAAAATATAATTTIKKNTMIIKKPSMFLPKGINSGGAAQKKGSRAAAAARGHDNDDDDDFDPMMSFVKARKAGRTNTAGTHVGTAAAAAARASACSASSLMAKSISGGGGGGRSGGGGYNSDEEVYAGDLGGADDSVFDTLGDNKNVEPLSRVDHADVNYQPFERDFHRESPDLSSISDHDAEARRREMDVHVVGVDPPRPLARFGQAVALDANVLKILKKHGYDVPTPIQAQAIPALLSGRNVLGIAKTGSGKTAAFLLPALVHLMDQPELVKGDGPIVLIMAPVRELAAQILTESRKFAKAYDGVRCAGVFGGASKHDQFKDLRAGAEIVVGTPGRLIDVAKAKHGLRLTRVTYLALDEADRMLDMGFEAQVRSLCDAVRPDRQTAMFSATMPEKIRRLTADVLGGGGGEGEDRGEAAEVLVITVGRPGGVNADVTQSVEVVENGDESRAAWLARRVSGFVDEGEVLVFVNRKQTAEDVEGRLRAAAGVRCGSLHGDMDQSSRQNMLTAFKRGEIHVLIATDVAARGLDVPTVRTVVSLYPPTSVESHVHRVGRTGRAGQKDGRAYTLVSPDTPGKFLVDLVRSLQHACQPVSSALHRLARRKTKTGPGGGKGGGKRKHIGGRGVGYPVTTMEDGEGKEENFLARQYDARKAAETVAAAAVATGTVPPPPPPPPPSHLPPPPDTQTSAVTSGVSETIATGTGPEPGPGPVPRGFTSASTGALTPMNKAEIVAPKSGWNPAAAAAAARAAQPAPGLTPQEEAAAAARRAAAAVAARAAEAVAAAMPQPHSLHHQHQHQQHRQQQSTPYLQYQSGQQHATPAVAAGYGVYGGGGRVAPPGPPPPPPPRAPPPAIQEETTFTFTGTRRPAPSTERYNAVAPPPNVTTSLPGLQAAAVQAAAAEARARAASMGVAGVVPPQYQQQQQQQQYHQLNAHQQQHHHQQELPPRHGHDWQQQQRQQGGQQQPPPPFPDAAAAAAARAAAEAIAAKFNARTRQ